MRSLIPTGATVFAGFFLFEKVSSNSFYFSGFPLGEFVHYTSDYLDQPLFDRLFGSKFYWKIAAALNLRYLLILKVRLINC